MLSRQLATTIAISGAMLFSLAAQAATQREITERYELVGIISDIVVIREFQNRRPVKTHYLRNKAEVPGLSGSQLQVGQRNSVRISQGDLSVVIRSNGRSQFSEAPTGAPEVDYAPFAGNTMGGATTDDEPVGEYITGSEYEVVDDNYHDSPPPRVTHPDSFLDLANIVDR